MHSIYEEMKEEEIANWISGKLVPWRKYTIAIDGRDNVGKSSLARYLAWKLYVPALETDFFMSGDGSLSEQNLSIIQNLICFRHKNDRPIIIEGIFMLQTLKSLSINPDILIRVNNIDNSGSITWESKFQTYESNYPRSLQPDCLYSKKSI